MRIFRHICVGFVNPLLDVHLALLLTHVEDLRVVYPGIPVNRWVHILHKKFAMIREVSGMLAINPLKDIGTMLGEMFMIDHDSKEFHEAASPTKRQRNSVTSTRGPATVSYISGSGKTQTGTITIPPRPILKGRHPCFAWICNRAPCFDSPTCVIAVPKNSPRKLQRPHLFDPVDQGVEAEFRVWVMKYNNH